MIKTPRKVETSVRMNMTPMIDVTFQLLIFFIVTLNFRTLEKKLDYRLPTDFGTGKSYILDLRDPNIPAVADSFVSAGPLASPHSFERLPGGNVLATFQNEGEGNNEPGGLAELDASGEVVRWAFRDLSSRAVSAWLELVAALQWLCLKYISFPM